MKPNFALSLSFDGLRLMHRVDGGWHMVGQVALDDPDLTGALARLREAAGTLDTAPMASKLLIPNDQIRYIALDTTRADDGDVRAALDGATPYAVDDLVYDFAKGGGRTYVAAVARETLEEAEQFAREHGFNPVSFAAVPEPFTYVGEASFGGLNGQPVERDADAVVIIGEADVTVPDPDPAPSPDPTPAADTEEPAPVDAPEVEDETSNSDAAPSDEDAPSEIADEAEPTDAEPTEPDQEANGAVAPPLTPDPGEDDAPTAADDPRETEPTEVDAASDTEVAAPEADAETDTNDTPEDAPVFASRLRADRNEGRPAAPEVPVAETPAAETPVTDRIEPTFSRRTPPSLAVPTGQGTDPMPAVAAPRRDDDGLPPVAPVQAETPPPNAAPAVTGEAPTALPPDAAIAAASLAVAPDPEPDVAPDTQQQSTSEAGNAAKAAGTAALGAATAVGSAVGGMFASRRMARAETRAKAQADAETTDTKDEKSRLTVFGARKPAKPKQVVGGKPRFLGLILTAILLLFLLAIAAFAALSDENIARWFGLGGSDTQVAAQDDAAPAVPEVATPTPTEAVAVAPAPDALANPTAPTGGQVLTPEEAQRIYAATGVWQRAPRIPQTPRTTTLDALDLAVQPRAVVRVPASPLADAGSVAGDAVIPTPVDPPPPSATFDFNEDGLVVATPEGAVTPDGILVIVGAPPLNPPTRPGTVAPEVTPQDQLAAVIPDTAAPLADAPEGVIVISGRPAIEPPVRPGTAAPATPPAAAALSTGDAPLVATDGLLVLAGSPSILPPIRPGMQPTPVPVAVTPTAPIDPDAEGLNIIAGPPPILPPARPGTLAPEQDASLGALSTDVATALSTATAQTPTDATLRPLTRPVTVVRAAAAVANTPVLGALTLGEAAAFRPRTRPAGLAPVPVEPPEPEAVQVAAPAPQTGLQIAPEIAAAVEAAANRPNPIVDATAQAVAVSTRPDGRPRNMARIVARAQEAQERAATQVAAVAPRTVAPSGPTGNAVAQNATLQNAINLRDVNLIGIYGGSDDRRALVRLANGRYQRVTVGDRLDGGQVTAISAGALSYTKRGRAITLQVPG